MATAFAKNISEALRLYRKASDLGSPVGMANLAVLYINGPGVAKNRDEGIRLLRKAADLGYELQKRIWGCCNSRFNKSKKLLKAEFRDKFCE